MSKRERLKGYAAQVGTLQRLNRDLAGEVASYRAVVRNPKYLWWSLVLVYLQRFIAWCDRAIAFLRRGATGETEGER